jgi:predicted transcriptional regulator YdeE
MSKAKTVIRTFSMRKDLVEALEKEAHSRGISVSTLLNQTVDRSVHQVWPSEKSGVLSLASDIVRGFLDHMSVEDVVKVGVSSAQEHKGRALILYGTEQRLESVLEMLDKITGPYFRWFVFTHTVNGRDHRILLNHDIGKKWSIFLEAYMKSFFLELLEIPVRSSFTDNAVVLEFRA